MDPIAAKLNSALKGTVVESLLSDLGRRFFFPRGIVSQSVEAAEHARRFNATAGMAYAGGKPMFLGLLRDLLPSLDLEEIFPYAPNAGLRELRTLWKTQLTGGDRLSSDAAFSLPIVVPGITAGVSLAGDMFVDEGDPVVVPDLHWGNYRLIFQHRRLARIITFPFYTQAGSFNVGGIREAVVGHGKRSKTVLMLNFPNNPTGYAPTHHEVQALVAELDDLCRAGYRLCVVLDDAYYGLCYEDDVFSESLFGPLSSLSENLLCIKVDGATKEDLAWGFRVGFVTFGSKALLPEHYAAIEQKTMGLLRASVSSSNRLAQSLIVRALRSPDFEAQKQEVYRILQERYRIVLNVLSRRRDDRELRVLPFNSGYFLTLECQRVDAEALRHYLLFERGIGTVSISPKHLRVAYSSVDSEGLAELFGEIFAAAHRLGS